MHKKLISITISILAFGSTYAQLESHRWYFTNGSNRGITFNFGTNIPALTTEHFNPYCNEGSGVANDPLTGALMFYAAQDKVRDANHLIMPNGNGMISDQSTAQTGIICPKPGNCNQYYLFNNTSTTEVGVGNCYYSVIDMSLPGNGTIPVPMGDVVAGQKNIFLKNNTGESSVLIKSTNSNKYWYILSTYDANELYIYQIDSTGVNLAGSYDIPYPITGFKNMSYSYEAGKIAVISGVEAEACLLLDFNRTTGTITAAATIPGTILGTGPWYWQGMYDAEWSTDGTKLYIGKYRMPSGVTGGKIYQYDLNLPLANAQLVFTNGGGYNNVMLGMRRGPDGKIYFIYDHPTHGFRYLGVIDSPNSAGAACNVIPLGFDLGLNPGPYCKFSHHLPPNAKPVALNDTIVFECQDTTANNINVLSNDSDIDDNAFTISFFNIPPGVNITQNPNQTINVTLSNPVDTLISVPYMLCDANCFSKCDTAYLILELEVLYSQDFLQEDTVVCNENSVTLTPLITGDSYLWNTSETTPSISVNASGVYELTMTIGGCSYSDSIIVFEANSPVIDLGPDTTLCEGYMTLDATYPNSTYLWSNSSIVPQIPVTVAGTYYVTVTNMCGSSTDTIVVNYATPIDFLEDDTLVCDTSSVVLSPSISGDAYFWNTSETTSSISVNTAGIYNLQITINGCSYSDSIAVLHTNSPSVDLGADTIICTEEFIILDATSSSSTYSWSTGAVVSQILVNTSGTYSVLVSNMCGSDGDTIEINFSSFPMVDLGPDTSVCEGDPFSLTAFWPGSTVLWSTGATTPVINITSNGTYWATITNDCGTVTDSVEVTVIKGCSGIEDINSSVQLYPNPASEYIYVTTPHQTLHLLSANLISIDGKNVVLENISQTSQGYYFNLGEISTGIYVLSMTFEEGKVNRKVIITR